MSQLDLSLAADVSSRHLSFLETGRSSPSRGMVLCLGNALELPLRERNALLLAAGYAPVYEEQDLDVPRMKSVRRALQLILTSHEPYPAFVLDRCWNVLEANRAHWLLLERMLGHGATSPAAQNVMRLVFDPGLLRPYIRNWNRVAFVLEERVRKSLRVPQPDPELQQLHDEIVAMPGVADVAKRRTPVSDLELLIPLEFEINGVVLSWFSMIANIGTALDVTLEELRVESLFPADEATESAVRSLTGA